jgi:hypothetical protein
LALSRAPGANAKTGLNRQRPSAFRKGKRHGRRPTTPVGFGLWVNVWDLFYAMSKDALKKCTYAITGSLYAEWAALSNYLAVARTASIDRQIVPLETFPPAFPGRIWLQTGETAWHSSYAFRPAPVRADPPVQHVMWGNRVGDW